MSDAIDSESAQILFCIIYVRRYLYAIQRILFETFYG